MARGKGGSNLKSYINWDKFIRTRNVVFILAVSIYLISGLFLLSSYVNVICSDGISYISIAQKYSRGDFTDAINGYWGPLISWLLLPFLFFGLPPLLGVKFLSLIIGVLTLIGIRLLSYKFQISETIRKILFFTLIPILLDFSLNWVTPDLLVVCISVYYLNIIFDSRYSDRWQKGALCGILGAVAYFAKMYAFYFFILHFTVFNLFHFLRSAAEEHKKSVLRNFLLGLVIFFVISSFWIGALSNKYKKWFTIGTAGSYNYAIIGPKYKHQSISSMGFLKPANETAVSAWEDPTYIELETWNPFQSSSTLKHQLKLVFNSLRELMRCIGFKFSVFSFAIILGYILFCTTRFLVLLKNGNVLFPLATVFLFPVGYLPLFLYERYLWLICILLLLMSGQLLTIIFHNSFFTGLKKNVTTVFVISSFVLTPLLNLTLNFGGGKEIYALSEVLAANDIRGNVASNNYDALTNKNWHNMLYLSYYLNNRYYGEAAKGISDEELLTYLIANDIDYYFVWDDFNNMPKFLSNYEEKTKGEIPNLRIYSLKERQADKWKIEED